MKSEFEIGRVAEDSSGRLWRLIGFDARSNDRMTITWRKTDAGEVALEEIYG